MVPHSQPTTSQVRNLVVLDAMNGTRSSVVPDINPAGMIKSSEVSSLKPKLLMMIGMNEETGPLAINIRKAVHVSQNVFIVHSFGTTTTLHTCGEYQPEPGVGKSLDHMRSLEVSIADSCVIYSHARHCDVPLTLGEAFRSNRVWWQQEENGD